VETIFALSNGFLGVRGMFEEGRPSGAPASYINGFHETWPIVHAEDAYGLAQTGQTIVNVPDATVLKLYVDDEPLYLPSARLKEYRRVLDMRAGTLTRELVWSTPAGKHVRVRSCRFVSLESRHLLAMTFEVEMLDRAAPVVVSSEVINRQDARPSNEANNQRSADPRLGRRVAGRVLECQVSREAGDALLLGYRTTHSGMTLGLGVHHIVEATDDHRVEAAISGDHSKVVVEAQCEPGRALHITKLAAYQASRAVPSEELVERCMRTLRRSVHDGVESLLARQQEHLARFWDRADVQVRFSGGSGRMQQAIRWNLFQLCQASWRAEGTGIPAKGLTGPAYEGHYFWDTEVYVLPFLSYTQPRIARNLLRFRHSMLGAARTRAHELALSGAAFPWRTINGEEASAYYAAGTAQYHINADIAYAIRRYVDVRGDRGFLVEVGAEILVETARLWADLGFHCPEGHFHIHGVTGPDEYTTVVNDNVYTNLMARLNLNYAVASVRWLQQERPADYIALVREVGLDEDEVEQWERAAAVMYIAHDDKRGINPQDDNFLEKEVWDLARTPPGDFPLLLHYHPLVIYRYQVVKQADVVLAMYLLGNEFNIDEKRRNFEYYEPLTTGDSSLSACVQSIVAAEIGDEEAAMSHFRSAVAMDLADVAGNVSDGVHIATSGGVWQVLVFGFGGVRDFDGRLTIDPRLPSRLQRLAFSLRFRDRQIRVELSHDRERYWIDEGGPLDLEIRGEKVRLEVGGEMVVHGGSRP
jgi:alpha,alpha-trehalose phosphorylase